VHSILYQAVQVQAPAREIVLLFFHSASLHPAVQMGTGEFNAGDKPAVGPSPIQRGVEIHVVMWCNWNQDKFLPDGLLGSHWAQM